MLQNAYLLAKIGADTAENERNFAENLATTLRLLTSPPGGQPPGGARGPPGPVAESAAAGRDAELRALEKAIFGRPCAVG